VVPNANLNTDTNHNTQPNIKLDPKPNPNFGMTNYCIRLHLTKTG